MTSSIAARLDRLPAGPWVWKLVALISFGAFFEIYDIYLSAPLSLALLAAGIFHPGAAGLFGLSDQASFIAATFAGLWLGSLAFGAVADRYGRRPIFAVALVWYALATCLMGLQSSALGIDACRFVASLGVGVELVAIDCYLAELAPKAARGRAFALGASIQFLSVPILAVLAWRLIPAGWLGLAGWRWLALFPALGAIGVWQVRRALPESPRWLADHDRIDEAEAIMRGIEAKVSEETGAVLPPPAAELPPAAIHVAASMWRPPWRRRTLVLIAFHLFQALGYYGFASWLPTLLVARGVDLATSLAYSVAVALVPPLAPLAFLFLADRFERKWLIVGGAAVSAVFGVALASIGPRSDFIVFALIGAAVAAGASLMSLAFHAYQSELFPTAIRARAVGFVYSFSRLSAMLSAYLIAAVLTAHGAAGVFWLVSGAMAAVCLIIALLGPRTRGLALEEI
ncbi:MAG TPA: MFS transporter [Caulobacteraceae bacterium]|nr:MFS transporter [Caulobacteraceae bacterium]